MTAIDRRTFLKGAATAVGGLSLAGPLGALLARQAAAGDGGSFGLSPGYGPLSPVTDHRTGMQFLALPSGFEYWSFGEVGSTMSDGRSTPPAHDAMAAFPAGEEIRLVRNHEVREPGVAFGPLDRAFDPIAGGGTTTLVFDPADPLNVVSFASLSGTSTNCAGGPTPWGSWLTCEETTTPFAQPHGYVFEVPASADAPVPAVPFTAMGRFIHEAVAMDPAAGIVYETEDADGAGFYRFIPDSPGLLSSGRLQMLAIQGRPGYDTRTGQTVGQSLRVAWVNIDDADPADGATTVYAQGAAKGGATFRRLEGAWWSGRDRCVYFTSTNGGDAGAGQVWAYTPRVTTSRPSSIPVSRLRLLYESPSAEALFKPDNITVSPRGGILLCEDADRARQTRLQGLTASGDVFEFAMNIRPGMIPGTATPASFDEFAGACFSPDGQWLFVNIQTPGISFAITGPWDQGPLYQMGRRSDWMRELAEHYEVVRRTYPDDDLCLVLDIDGTILDTRHLVVHVLLAYDREHGTAHFHGLRPEDVTVHENQVEALLENMALPAKTRQAVLHFYLERWRSPEAALAAHRPYRGVLGVIRWFQLQPATVVALNTGRPEDLREATLASLNALGRTHRVGFTSDLLYMNPHGWDQNATQAKVEAIRRLRARGLRIFAAIDNEPENIRAMAEADSDGEILFLHAETIFESQRVAMPRTVTGTTYDLSGLVSEAELRQRVQLVWHGVNDQANLRQFLASGVHWAECDVRVDPLGRLVLRHDSFEETPWHPAESSFLFVDCLQAIRELGRRLVVDFKEGDHVVDRVLEEIGACGFDSKTVWFNGAVEALHEDGFRRLGAAYPEATITCPVDFLAPLLLAAPDRAAEVLDLLRSWGVNRLSLAWTTPAVRELIDVLETLGWDVNLYGVPDLEAFLEAALLVPRSLTADFNFPDWNYFGRGSGKGSLHHLYELAPTMLR